MYINVFVTSNFFHVAYGNALRNPMHKRADAKTIIKVGNNKKNFCQRYCLIRGANIQNAHE